MYQSLQSKLAQLAPICPSMYAVKMTGIGRKNRIKAMKKYLKFYGNICHQNIRDFVKRKGRKIKMIISIKLSFIINMCGIDKNQIILLIVHYKDEI